MRACILLCLLTLAAAASAQPALVSRRPLDDLAGRYVVGDHPGFNWVDAQGRAAISVGSRHGLQAGQYLWAKDEAGEQIAVEVVHTAENSSFVERRDLRYNSFRFELVPGLRITGGP